MSYLNPPKWGAQLEEVVQVQVSGKSMKLEEVTS